MKAVIELSATEFNKDAFDRIVNFLAANSKPEFAFQLMMQVFSHQKETKEEYFSRLDKSIKQAAEGNVVTFTWEAFEEYNKKPSQRTMSKVQFTDDAMRQFHKWSQENLKTVKRIVELMDSIRQDPFTGIGKPEALKHQYRGYWSRRISDEHRLIYKVDSERNVTIYSLFNHYPED